MPIFAQVADGRAENKKKGDPPSVHLVRRIGLAELQDKQQTGQDKFVTGQEEETRRDPQSQRSIDQNERDSQRVRRNPLKHTAQGGWVGSLFPFSLLFMLVYGNGHPHKLLLLLLTGRARRHLTPQNNNCSAVLECWPPNPN